VTSDTCHGSTISSADCLRKLNHALKVGQLYRSSDVGFTVRGSNRQYCFRREFFFSVGMMTREPRHLARCNFAWTCTLTTAQNPQNFKVKWSRSQHRIFRFFTIARWGTKFVDTITHEPLHSASWSFAWTCTSTTSRTLLNFKVIGQRSSGYPQTVLSLEQGLMILLVICFMLVTTMYKMVVWGRLIEYRPA